MFGEVLGSFVKRISLCRRGVESLALDVLGGKGKSETNGPSSPDFLVSRFFLESDRGTNKTEGKGFVYTRE